jgi:outer membrane protein OmpA-like peptidoglycan-associated protein
MNIADRFVKLSSISATMVILNACVTPATVVEEIVYVDPTPTRIDATDLSLSGIITTDAELDAVFRRQLDIGVSAILPNEIEAYLDEQENRLKNGFETSGMTVNDLGDYVSVRIPVQSMFSMQGSDLAPHAFDDIEALADFLAYYQSSIVEISSHTVASDSKEYDLNVSERRASTIANMLEALDVDSERLITVAGGSDHPISQGDSDRDRDINLRVELNLIPIRDREAEAEAAATAAAAMAALEDD